MASSKADSTSGVSRRAVVAGGLALAANPPAFAAAPAGTVRAPAGDFVGTREGGVHAFRGIRYGRAERFRAAVPVAQPGTRIAA
jgi:para-nitrobenzyl esterase